MAMMASKACVLAEGVEEERAVRSVVEPPRRSPAEEVLEVEDWIWEAAKRLVGVDYQLLRPNMDGPNARWGGGAGGNKGQE